MTRTTPPMQYTIANSVGAATIQAWLSVIGLPAKREAHLNAIADDYIRRQGTLERAIRYVERTRGDNPRMPLLAIQLHDKPTDNSPRLIHLAAYWPGDDARRNRDHWPHPVA